MKVIAIQTIAFIFFLQVDQALGQAAFSLQGDKAFSTVAAKAANQKLIHFNKYGSTKARVMISLFHVGPVNTRVSRSQDNSTKEKLEDLVKIDKDPVSEEKNNMLFTNMAIEGDKNAKSLFDKAHNKNNLLIVNISLGKCYVNQDETTSYYHYSVLKGDNVREEIAEDVTAILEGFKKASKHFDFDKNNEFEQNDRNLNELVSGFFSDYSMPLSLYWDDESNSEHSGWDNNKEEFTKNYPSYTTTPVSGIPWKCIPGDNTFVPLKVETGVSETGASSRLRFRLTNSVNFKLRSPTLDKEGLLWIAGDAKNKETSIVPNLDGTDLDVYRVNVIAYEKIIKTVAVVVVEEENDDIQLVAPGTKGLDPDTPVVEAGPNGFLDTKEPAEQYKKTYSVDDQVVCDDKKNCYFTAGPNGICETFANSENLKPEDLGFDLAKFQEQLNKLYNPYQVEFKVEMVPHRIALNYDIDLNGYYDPDSYVIQNGEAMQIDLQEEKTIYTNSRIGNSNHYLFFVKGVNNQTVELLGRETKFESAIINIDNIKSYADTSNSSDVDLLYKTCAHELGHAALKLTHSPSSDDPNLMHAYSDKGVILRKSQWDIIHGLLSPTHGFK